MTTEEPPSTTSPFHKPLHLLTDDDISQVTREQCRQFLFQKGMRRPSWNKSQAIQQVIMLKALLEPSPDSDFCFRKRQIFNRHQETPTTRVQKGTTDKPESVQCNGVDETDIRNDNDFVSPGITGSTDKVKGQMAIFYSGKVNVYDDIPTEKLAARPLELSQEAQVDVNVTASSLKCHLQIPNTKSSTDSSVMLLPILQTGSASRKASVQRYLEKRKDRFKNKRKLEGPAFDSLDAYISSNQICHQDQTEHSNGSYAQTT